MRYVGTAKLDGLVQNVTYTGTAAAMATAFGLGVQRARIVSTTDCWIAQGKAPTATTSGVLLPALTVEYISVSPGEKLSAVQSSAGGILNVTETP